MLGNQNRQTSFLDMQTWFNGPIIKPDSIYGLLAEWGDRLIRDEDFIELYGSTGRPSISPSLLSKVLLLMYHDNISDREAEDRAKYDLRWKVALCLPMNEAGFDHTALCRFRARLLTNQKQKFIFERFVQLAREVGIVKDNGLQIIDSTNILGAAATKDTYTLIKSAIQKLLAVSAKKHSEAEQLLKRLTFSIDYTKNEKEQIDWDDAAVRHELLNRLVKDSRSIVKALQEVKLTEEEQSAVEILETVTEQDIEQSGENEVSLKQGVSQNRIISVRDPEMRHGHKSSTGKFNGYKAQIVMDETSEIITNVDITPGNQADGDAVDELLKTTLVKPSILMGDTAYGTLSARQIIEDHNVVPVAPLPMGSKSTDKFSKYDFVIDWENRTCQCPSGHISMKVYIAKKDETISAFVFDKKICNHCDLRDRCTEHGKGRKVKLHPEEARRRSIIQQNSTPEFKTFYRQRAKVERKIAHLVRRGIRKTKYIGEAKTFVQVAFAATVVNIKGIFALAKGEVSLFSTLQRVLGTA